MTELLYNVVATVVIIFIAWQLVPMVVLPLAEWRRRKREIKRRIALERADLKAWAEHRNWRPMAQYRDPHDPEPETETVSKT